MGWDVPWGRCGHWLGWWPHLPLVSLTEELGTLLLLSKEDLRGEIFLQQERDQSESGCVLSESFRNQLCAPIP